MNSMTKGHIFQVQSWANSEKKIWLMEMSFVCF